MHERAHLIGGEIDIKGRAGKGTVVIVRVPIFGHETNFENDAARAHAQSVESQ
jgi:nitrate/nitrite-specific signal transduction histidine kinase